MGLGIGLNQRDLFGGSAGQFQVADGFLVDGENCAGGTELGRHIGNRRPVGERQPFEPVAEEFDELVDHAFLAQHLCHGQHQIGRRRARRQRSSQLKADDLGNQHGDRLTQHCRFGLDAADAPAQHAQSIDHGGVRVRADQGVRICRLLVRGLVRKNNARQPFDIDLVHDARVRRHHFEIAERGLSPAQEHIAFAVALKLNLVIVLQ